MSEAKAEGPGLRDVVRKEIDGLMDNARHDCATNRAVAVDRIVAALLASPSAPSEVVLQTRYKCRIHGFIKNKDVHHWHYTDDNERCDCEALRAPEPPQGEGK